MSTFLRLSALTFLLLARVVSGAEPGNVEIQHDPVQCWPTDQFLFVDSFFEPPVDLQTAKVYFRSSLHPDYYFVEMTLGRDGGGRAIVPMAAAQTPEVVYYVELVTKSFSAFRTSETTVPVSSGSECQRRDPEAAFYNGPNPDMTVGATRAGASQIPPGFQPNGISRFISITGPGGGGGGGVSGKTIGIIAGVGGGTAAALVFAGGSSDATTSAIGGGVTTVTTTTGTTTTVTGGGPSSTTTTASGGGPSSTTTTVSGGGPSSTTTTVVGPTTTTSVGPSTTTTTGGPSTTTTSGPSTTTTSSPTTTTSGPSTTTTSGPTTTTSAPTTTTSAPSTTTTAATTSVSGANVTVSKGASGAAVRGGSFTYTVTVTNNGPGTATSVLLRDDLPGQLTITFTGGGCSGGASPVLCSFGTMASGASRDATIGVFVPISVPIGTVLTNSAEVGWIDSIARTSSTSHNITVSALRTDPPSSVELSYRSVLEVRPRNPVVRGSVVLNGQSAQDVDSSAPRLVRATARGRTNRIEAYHEPTSSSGSWLFDFAGATGFEPASLKVESGEVVSMDGYSITFAVRTGSAPARFTFELRNDLR